MNNHEAIDAVRTGGRCETRSTLHGLKIAENCGAPCQHSWRVVACDSETDVLECEKCSAQKLAKCNFDEDYA